MKKLVIFDLDGTLVDSIYDLADCVNSALRKFSLSENTLSEYYSFVGNGMESLVRKSMKSHGNDDNLYKQVRGEFDALYKEHCSDKTVAYEGLASMLSKLTDKGIATAVLTNKAHEFVDGILHRCFPEHKFTVAWGNKEGRKRKPDPEALIALVEQEGCDVADCVYVGDSEVDVSTAKNAGMDLVCVLWGFRSETQLKACGADIMVKDAQELYETLISM